MSIAKEAARLHNFVRIDMEGSAWTQKTLDLFYSVHGQLTNMGIVLQSALRRTEGDCRDAVERGVRVRLCKGAYHEPASIAYTNRDEVNASYDRCAQILARAPYPAFATHDDARINVAVHACQSQGLQKSDYELQMLYGLRSSRWRELHDQGHVVRIYVPYGTHWLAYFYRRLRERKENVLFVLRNFFR
jgi:proline dehydrogenase